MESTLVDEKLFSDASYIFEVEGLVFQNLNQETENDSLRKTCEAGTLTNYVGVAEYLQHVTRNTPLEGYVMQIMQMLLMLSTGKGDLYR